MPAVIFAHAAGRLRLNEQPHFKCGWQSKLLFQKLYRMLYQLAMQMNQNLVNVGAKRFAIATLC